MTAPSIPQIVVLAGRSTGTPPVAKACVVTTPIRIADLPDLGFLTARVAQSGGD